MQTNTDVLKALSKLTALNELPDNYFPMFYFGEADCEGGYGWHKEVFIQIRKREEYCIKCGYVAGDNKEEECIEKYLNDKGYKVTDYAIHTHRHSWHCNDYPIGIFHLRFETEIEEVNNKILELSERIKSK